MLLQMDEIKVLDRIRKDNGDIHELTESIREYGLMNPLTVVKVNNEYVLIAGFRRYCALQELGETMADVNEIINDDAEDIVDLFVRQCCVGGLVENILQRCFKQIRELLLDGCAAHAHAGRNGAIGADVQGILDDAAGRQDPQRIFIDVPVTHNGVMNGDKYHPLIRLRKCFQMTALRVCCLYRVSTTRQVDVITNGNDTVQDISMQRIACHDLVQAKGWTITAEYQEAGISGFHNPTFEREAIRQIIDSAERKEFDILLVYAVDRISRRDYELPMLFGAMHDCGIVIWSVKEGELPYNDSDDRLKIYLFGWKASGESERLGQRIQTKHSQMVARGEYRGARSLSVICLKKPGKRPKEAGSGMCFGSVRVRPL